jgi:hypothetical protein
MKKANLSRLHDSRARFSSHADDRVRGGDARHRRRLACDGDTQRLSWHYHQNHLYVRHVPTGRLFRLEPLADVQAEIAESVNPR